MFRHAIGKHPEILDAAGAKILTMSEAEDPLGEHPRGRCGADGVDPKTSVLNAFCHAHQCKNLFVVEESAFPAVTPKNPTITIMGLAWRASEYLLDRAKRGAQDWSGTPLLEFPSNSR